MRLKSFPPPLVQRCKGTTVGLGYLEVNVICLCNGWLTSVPTVDPHWGEWQNSSADFNPNNNHVNAAPKQARLQTTSRPQHHACNLPEKLLYVKCTRLNTNL
jgi:hypothetical protein